MNHVANITLDNSYVGPNGRPYVIKEEEVKCSYYCGRPATTNNKGEPCCYECLAEIIENDKDYEMAQEIARTQEAFINSIN